MASQNEIQDAIYAKQLQDEEYQQQRQQNNSRQIRSAQEIRDEEYARKILAEQEQNNFSRSGLNRNQELQEGKSMIVKLLNPTTKKQIGEPVLALNIGSNTMCFELANHPGKRMRVTHNGSVEFSQVYDDSSIFCITPTSKGAVYISCRAYEKKLNFLTSKSSYLTMSGDGSLSGHGLKSDFALWVFLSATGPTGTPQLPAPIPPNTAAAIQPSHSTRPPPQPPTEIVSQQINPLTSSYVAQSTELVEHVAKPTPTPSNSSNPKPLPFIATSGEFPGYDAGRDSLMKFFSTESGMAFITQPEFESALQLFELGLLSKLLYRPDWPMAAKRFKDYPKLFCKANDAIVDNVSFDNIKSFFEQGYLVAFNIVPHHLLSNANKMTNYWSMLGIGAVNGKEYIRKCQKDRIELIGAITSDVDILALYYETPLVHVVQRLLGNGEVQNPTAAQIVMTFPTLNYKPTGASPNSENQWIIDGFDNYGNHSPYSLLLGIALTDIMEPNQGNYCIHIGSQLILMESFKEMVMRKNSLFSQDPSTCSKPDLGEPTQLLMKAGDAFICSQRLAYLHAPNYGSAVTSIVYFRISHIDHEYLKDPALDSIWLEFPRATNYLEGKRTIKPMQESKVGDLLTIEDNSGSNEARVTSNKKMMLIEDESENMQFNKNPLKQNGLDHDLQNGSNSGAIVATATSNEVDLVDWFSISLAPTSTSQSNQSHVNESNVSTSSSASYHTYGI